MTTPLEAAEKILALDQALTDGLTAWCNDEISLAEWEKLKAARYMDLRLYGARMARFTIEAHEAEEARKLLALERSPS